MFGLVVVPANTRRASSGANRSRDPAWQPLGIPSDGWPGRGALRDLDAPHVESQRAAVSRRKRTRTAAA